MFKNKSMLAAPIAGTAVTPRKPGGTAIDLLAVISGIAMCGLGGSQLIAPLATAALSGFAGSIAADVLAVQWLFFGALLLIGGITRLRVVTIFAAEFVMIGCLAALAVQFVHDPRSAALLLYGVLAILAFACSGFARLSDKADLKRELRLVREHAAVVAAPGAAPEAVPSTPLASDPHV